MTKERMNALHNEFLVIVANGLVGYKSLYDGAPEETYAPPTMEQVMDEYRNNVNLNRCVHALTYYLMDRVTMILLEQGKCDPPCFET